MDFLKPLLFGKEDTSELTAKTKDRFDKNSTPNGGGCVLGCVPTPKGCIPTPNGQETENRVVSPPLMDKRQKIGLYPTPNGTKKKP